MRASFSICSTSSPSQGLFAGSTPAVHLHAAKQRQMSVSASQTTLLKRHAPCRRPVDLQGKKSLASQGTIDPCRLYKTAAIFFQHQERGTEGDEYVSIFSPPGYEECRLAK